MNINFKPVMAALFAHLQAAATITFTAYAAQGQNTLTGVSGASNACPGLPVFGPGMPENVVIVSISADGTTITLSDMATQSGVAQTFTTGFLTTGRRVQHWSQVSAQPALFLRRTAVHDDETEDGLIMTTLECEAWIYCNAGQNPDVDPDDALTGLETLIRASMAPGIADDEGRFTLGGIAYWCRISGHGDISAGDQGPQAIARIPIRITLP